VDGSIKVGGSNPQVIYALSAQSPETAGNAFNFTATAEFSDGSPDPFYNGTAHFSSTDPLVVLPPDATFTAGTSTLTLSATLRTAGTQTLTATDTADSKITGTSNSVLVNPAAASQVVITQQPSPTATAGVAFATQPVVKLEDQYGNVETGDMTHTVTAASTGTAALLGTMTLTLSSGVATFTDLSYKKAETIQLQFTTSAGSFTATSNNVVVSPSVASHFALVAPSLVTAGAPFNFTVTALDAFGNTATGYAGTAHFTSSDGQAGLPADSTLTSGVGTFSATLRTVGGQTLSATDTADGSVTGTSNAIQVSGDSAQFVTTDATTHGYWQGAYGGDGYNVVAAGAPSYPSYAAVTTAGNSAYTWAGSTVDPRALQKPAAPADRVAAAWYSTTSFTVDVNLTDGAAHQVALYLLDWDGNGRGEKVDVLDAASGDVLDTRTASGFGGGQYLVWTLGGHVQLRLTRQAGNNAVLNGLFFGPAGPAPTGGGSALFVTADASTQGSWKGHYGGDGSNVVGAGTPSYPSYATVRTAGNSQYTWAASTPGPRALQKPANPADRVAAAWLSTGTFVVDVNLTGGTHQVALYLLDWDGNGRSEQIDVLDAASGRVLDTRTVSGFAGGEYLVWDVSGDVAFRLTRRSGNNAVLSGLFFDPVA
jgi:hypothetical protein